ncbi:MAG: hypothetical protein E5X76_20135 [Mesorhizobium sp.]|nr:MAG: hypothetical protein E5X76_20135 [Mesorhizobium sp.]
MGFLVPLFASIGAAISGVVSWIGGSAILSGLARFGLGLAAKYAIGALLGQQKPQAQAAQLDTNYGEDLARVVAMGKVGVAGTLEYRNAYGSGNRKVQDVYKLSDFRITGITRVRYKGEWKTLGGVEDAIKGFRIQDIDSEIWVKLYQGTMTQTADPGLIANANPAGRWTVNHRGAGIAYVVVTNFLNREHLTAPWQAFFEIQGAPLYDWRKDSSIGGSGAHRWDDQSTWEFSENPVLMAYALERGIFNGTEMMVGKGVPASRLPLGNWTLAANICDENVGSGKRYSAGLIAAAGSGVTHDQNLQPLLEASAATWVEKATGEYPIVGAPQSIAFTFTDDDIMVDEPFRFSLKRTKSELINTLAGTYLEPDNFYQQTPLAIRIDAAALAEDRERLAVSVPYGAVNRSEVGDRLADIAFKASRYQANGEICLHPKFLAEADPGLWVQWTSAEFGTTFTFQMLDKRLGAFGEKAARNIYVALQEVGDGIFDGSPYVTVPTVPVLPGAPDYANAATNFLAAPIQLQVAGSSERKPGIRFTWDAFDDVTVVAVEIEYRPEGQTDSIVTRVDLPLQVKNASDGVLADTIYEYRHRIIADPPRTTFFTDWANVTTAPATLPDVSVSLAQLQQDVRDFLQRVSGIRDDVNAKLAQLAAAALEAAGRQVEDNAVARRFRDASAVAFTELDAEITDINGQLAATATALTAVQASVSDVSAGGLFRIRAEAGSGDVVARLILEVRASVGATWVSSGLYMEAGFTGGNPAAPFSNLYVNTGKFVVTDGANSSTPLTFESGELKALIGRFGTIISAVLQSADGKFVQTVSSGKLEWFD